MARSRLVIVLALVCACSKRDALSNGDGALQGVDGPKYAVAIELESRNPIDIGLEETASFIVRSQNP